MKILISKQNILAVLVSLIPVMASADVVVVVGAGSQVHTLTPEQVSQIFLGKTGAFPGGAKATPLDQADGIALRDEFYSKVTNKTRTQMYAYRSNLIFSGKGKLPQEVGNSAAIKKMLAENPELIAYMEASAVDASVKVVLNL